MRRLIVILITAATVLGPVHQAQAATPTPDQQWARIQQIVGGITGRWTNQAYPNSTSRTMPDTALLGNGDVGITSGGGDGFKRFHVSKGNFWNGNNGTTIVPVGDVTIRPVSGAPSGNLALGATATASSSHGSFPPSRAVSGQWGPGYEGWVSEVGKPQSITIDLAVSKTFNRYVVRHDSAARPAETANNTKNFTVAVSSDNSTWSTVDTVNNNTAATTDRTISSVNARWIRLTATEPTQGTTPDSINNPRARIGQLELYAGGSVPPSPGAPFLEEQNILRGDIETTMTIGGVPVVMRTWLGATDNVLVTQIQSQGSSAVRLRAETTAGSPEPRGGMTNTSGVAGNTGFATRQTAGGSNWVSRASIATRVVGANLVGAPTSGGATASSTFDLQPGATVRIVSGIAGGGPNNPDPAPAARSLVDGQSAGSLDSLYNGHLDWWKQYWLRSYIDIGDDVLQRFYYGSLYLTGSASRTGKTAPGLYGLWVTSDFPSFNGDMHLNYNWMANFYGVYSSNRPQLALPYFDLVRDYLPEARRRSQQDLRSVKSDYVSRRFPNGIAGGVLFPVGIGPFGATTDNNYWQQVGNALFTATQYVAYYDYTQDRNFLSGTAYPFMKEVATFFRSWVEFDQGSQRYNLWSGPHEGSWGRNSSPDLGMLRYLLAAVINASVELNVDAGDRQAWTDILNRLAPIPTTTVNGQRVYALADPGTMQGGDTRIFRPGDNTVNLEFIHPGEVLGLGSDPAERQTAIDTVNQMNSWGQGNSFPKVFTQAARVGYPAASLIDRMKEQINAHMVANLRIADGVHGIEKAGAIEAIDNMLLQSDDGVIRVFPAWPGERNASFVKLREKNAFLVSSARSGNRVSYVDVTSEAGRQVRLQHPWPGQNVTVTQAGGGSVGFTIQNNVITFATQTGATYTISSALT